MPASPNADAELSKESRTVTWFVPHDLLGYPIVANYDGSWTERGSMVGVPVERGIPVLACGA